MPRRKANPIIDGYRVCLDCGERKPVDAHHYYQWRGRPVRGSCILCSNAASSRNYFSQNRDRAKANSAFWLMHKRLRKLGRQGEPTASKEDLYISLCLYKADLRAAGIDYVPHLTHNCHAKPLSKGGTCLASNLYWGLAGHNKDYGDMPLQEQKFHLTRAMLAVESALATEAYEAALRTTQSGCMTTGAA